MSARKSRQIGEGSTLPLKVQYFDDDGRPLARAAMTGLTLTLLDARTASVINSRDAQSVLDANNGDALDDLTVSAATASNPVRLTFSAEHKLESGMLLHLSGIVGMTELNGRTVAVKKVSDTEIDLDDVDGSDFTAYTSGGTGRIGLLVLSLQPADNVIAGLTITAVSQADEAVVTFAEAHQLTEGDELVIIDVVGMTELNGRRFRVRPEAYNTATLLGEDSSAHTAYASAGTARPPAGKLEPHRARLTLTHSGGTHAHGFVIDVEALLDR